MANNKHPKHRRLKPRPRLRTIHVIGGHVTDAPPGMEVPFLGEVMTCLLCGAQQESDPSVESQWRALQLGDPPDHKSYYACPDEFPPDDASRGEFTEAYTKFLMAAIERFKVDRKEH